MKNWWDYHKWYVILGAILVGIMIYLFLRLLGIGQVHPDFQIAYIGSTPLPEDTVAALEREFSKIADDFNGDGEVIVQIHQYVNASKSQDADAAYYEYGSEIALIGDINDGDSYFFLMDDPETFQRAFHVLAEADGSAPAELDYTIDDKVLSWADCPVLSNMDLGSYSTAVLGQNIHGDSQELMESLYIGRRYFYEKDKTNAYEPHNRLWDFLTAGHS